MLTYGLLIFNRNNTTGVIRLAKLLSDIVDEIVIIDSSDPLKYDELMAHLMSHNLNALVFRAIPLGHVEPFRMYGLNKIGTEYVLLLDTDELPNTKLIKNLRRHDEYDGYVIKRYESSLKMMSNQIRLFRRDKVLFRGIIHENPEILGKIFKLPNDEFIIHIASEPYVPSFGLDRYLMIELFSRYPYLINNLLFRKIRKKVYYTNKTLVHDINAILLLTYYKVRGLLRSRDADMWFSYFANLFRIFSNISDKFRKILIDISREVYENGGIINYLCFNDPKVVESLTETYSWNLPGLKVFQYLILYRYKYKRCARDFRDVLETFYPKPH